MSSLTFLTLFTLDDTYKPMTDPIKYIEIRIEQLNEELKKNSSNGNDLILNKAISELNTVLDMLKRNRLLSMNPMGDT